ncbi:MAG: hypothetical protein R2705_24935 [Ilumatobacteraceae bacterium]
MYGALLVMLKRIGPVQHHYRSDHYGWGWYAEELDAQLTPLLLELYRDREPREVDELVETMWNVLQDEYDLSDVPADKLAHHRSLVENALRPRSIGSPNSESSRSPRRSVRPPSTAASNAAAGRCSSPHSVSGPTSEWRRS